MTREIDGLLFYGPMLIPIAFVLIVWLHSRRPYPAWAKAASILACAAGLTWDIIALLQSPLSMRRYPFLLTVSVKQTLAGIFIGIAISVVMAHEWKSR